MFFVLSCLVARPLALNDSSFLHPDCPSSFECGKLGFIRFPFNNESLTDCGLYTVKNCGTPHPKIQLKRGGLWVDVVGISQANVINISDSELQKQIDSRSCSVLRDLALQNSSSSSLSTPNNLTLYNCTQNPKDALPLFISSFSCPGYYTSPNFSYSLDGSTCNSKILVPVIPVGPNNPVSKFTADFQLQVTVHGPCYECFFHKGGKCSDTKGNFVCKGENTERRKGNDFYVKV